MHGCAPANAATATASQRLRYTAPKRNFEVFAATDWLAALTAHIPNAGEHLVGYYGWYSNVTRGKRRKVARDEGNASPVEAYSQVPNATAKRAWARLITQVYEADPLGRKKGTVVTLCNSP